LQDTGHVLFDNHGCGVEERKRLDSSIGKTKSFREASEEMWGSLNVTLPEALKTLKKNLIIDKDFKYFFDWCQERGIPFTVISAGLKPLLRAALDEFLGPQDSKKINIVSNDGVISDDGKWKVVWRHDTPLGHDKAQSVLEFKKSVKGIQPLIVFIGDGVSDLAAASQADILFARRGLALEEYCIEHRIPYIPYDRFNEIIVDVQLLVKGNKYHDPEAKAAADKTLPISARYANGTSTTPSTQPKAYFPLEEEDSSNSDEDSPVEKASDTPSAPTIESVPSTTATRPSPLRHFSVGTVPTSSDAQDK
jgi:2,3-diketo-5-methylthio-1-phosphopentane phosphatase